MEYSISNGEQKTITFPMNILDIYKHKPLKELVEPYNEATKLCSSYFQQTDKNGSVSRAAIIQAFQFLDKVQERLYAENVSLSDFLNRKL